MQLSNRRFGVQEREDRGKTYLAPTVTFDLDTGAAVEFIGYHGGVDILVQELSGEEITVLHWGYNPQRGSYDPPDYSATYFASVGEAKSFCGNVLAAAHEALDSDDFLAFFASAKDRQLIHRAWVRPSIQRRSPFSLILAAMSDHLRADSASATGAEYIQRRLATEAARAGHEPDSV